MSLRKAKNKLVGRPTFQPQITLGYRTDGSPGVTVAVNYDKGYGCFVSPVALEQFIADLWVGVDHLKGEDVDSFLS